MCLVYYACSTSHVSLLRTMPNPLPFVWSCTVHLGSIAKLPSCFIQTFRLAPRVPLIYVLCHFLALAPNKYPDSRTADSYKLSSLFPTERRRTHFHATRALHLLKDLYLAHRDDPWLVTASYSSALSDARFADVSTRWAKTSNRGNSIRLPSLASAIM